MVSGWIFCSSQLSKPKLAGRVSAVKGASRIFLIDSGFTDNARKS